VGRNIVLGSERRAVGASRLGRSATEGLRELERQELVSN
jgi:hypothetical protein